MPLPPARLLDTRTQAGPVAGGGHVEIDMRPFVPAGATAVAVNLTSDATHEPGFLTGYPCDRPQGSVSNVNHAAGVPRGAMAVVPLSADGSLCVFTRTSGHVIVDLQGAFVTGNDDGTRLTPIDPPQRLLDTRQTGRANVVEVDAPAGAAAVAINLTGDQRPSSRMVEGLPVRPSRARGLERQLHGAATRSPWPHSCRCRRPGTFCVQTLVPVDIVVDITGVFTANGALEFVPAEPTRMLDTRSGLGGWSPIHGGGQTLDVRVVPPDAEAVTATITIVGPLRDGWLAASACGRPTPTSSVNAVADAVFANATTVGVDDAGKVCLTRPVGHPDTVRRHRLVGRMTPVGRWPPRSSPRSPPVLPSVWRRRRRRTPPATALAPPDKRLYIVTDSVGLGAERAFPPAFPGWDVILDGDAGEFTETMARRYVAPRAGAAGSSATTRSSPPATTTPTGTPTASTAASTR